MTYDNWKTDPGVVPSAEDSPAERELATPRGRYTTRVCGCCDRPDGMCSCRIVPDPDRGASDDALWCESCRQTAWPDSSVEHPAIYHLDFAIGALNGSYLDTTDYERARWGDLLADARGLRARVRELALADAGD